MKFRLWVNYSEAILGLLCGAYYWVCDLMGYDDAPVLSVWSALCIVLVMKGLWGAIIERRSTKPFRYMSRATDAVIALSVLCVLAFSGFVIKGMYEKPKPGCEYIIVLGAAVNGTKPSEVLEKRIDTAYEYLAENPSTKAVAAGGRGEGEKISEGECIRNELERRGIAAERIEFEDQSTTTVENFRFAAEKLPQEVQSIAVVSSGFHISRAKLILRNFTDAEVSGVPASRMSIPVPHYILRELAVFIIDIAQGNYSVLR